MEGRKVILFLAAVMLMVTAGCTRRDKALDARVDELSALAEVCPDSALRLLDSIAPAAAKAPEASRMRHALATVKAQDKAYLHPASDSAIVPIIKYYAHRPASDTLRPMAFYYAGRVYSDLGDAPQALDYFGQALNLLPPDTDNPRLRGNVLSQTGRLLNSLRLYDQAVPYIKECLEIDRLLNDTINEVYDLQLLGNIYLRAEHYQLAEESFNAALELSAGLPPSFHVKSSMLLGAVKYKIGQLDSALILIRDTPQLVNPISRHNALAYASEVYLKAGIKDTAYMYAHELINSTDFTNKKTGYQVLLSSEMRDFLEVDSLGLYISDYRDVLERFFNESEMQLAIYQHSLYNYQFHQRERQKAEYTNAQLRYWVTGFLFLILLLCVLVLYFRNRNKSNIIELHVALENLNKIKQTLEERRINNESTNLTTYNSSQEQEETATELRTRLREELLSLYRKAEKQVCLSPLMLQDTAYQELQNFIKEGKEINEKDPLWESLEVLVLKVSPHFKINLKLLTGGKLTSYDWHTTLLIKCGVSPSQMTILLGRSKGAIVSRRESLCLRIFDEKLGTKVIDGIIRLL